MRSTAPLHARLPRRQRHGLLPHRLAGALARCALLTLPLTLTPAFTLAQTQTLPTGLNVVAGQAQVSTQGSRMTVTNTPQAILNWNSFSIGSGQSVYFQQHSSTSAVLNRVVGNDPSNILGSLGSNGRVWLLNPNGVLFGHNARVDVAGLVSSTLRLDDGDWLAGRFRFGAGGSNAEVVNQGSLRTPFGGHVALIGASVRNEGLVEAPGGQVVLAAGHSVELVDTGAPNVGVRVTAPAGAVRNLGELRAAGGRIDIHAAAVNQQGLVSADAFAAGAGGEVWIKASESLDLGGASRTSADGAQGGAVRIEAVAGRSTIEGNVSATGSAGNGGQVLLLGREVGLLGQSRVDASGANGGGEVLVGGGESGRDARFANARAVYFGPQSSITADAQAQGDGGRIVLWSDQATRAFGSLSARGGSAAGNGGFIETSGGWLDARPARLDARAPKGRAGQWLLDPYDILITDSVSSNQGVDTAFNPISSPAIISTATINPILDSGVDVTISTAGAGNEHGDITVQGASIGTSQHVSSGDLRLVADRNIVLNNSTVGGSFYATVGLLLSAGNGSTGTGKITVGSTLIDTIGPIHFEANSIELGVGTQIYGGFFGSPIVMSGRNGAPLSEFRNTSNGSPIDNSSSTFVIYADRIDSPNFVPGQQAYDYKRVNATYGYWTEDESSSSAFAFAAPHAATVTGTVQDRVYNGTKNAAITNAIATSSLFGDGTINTMVLAEFVDKNAGVNKPAVFVGHDPFFFFDSNGRSVYGVTVNGSLTGTITPAPLTGQVVSALDKVYDGTTRAQVTVGNLVGLVGSDQVNVVADALFGDKNVGTGKAVSVVSYQVRDGVSGDLGANYTFTPSAPPPQGLVASITPLTVSFYGLQVASKVYDGTTSATLTGNIDAPPNDDVSLAATASARFVDKNVGTAKPVVLEGLSLTGADAGNYVLETPPTLTGSITPRPLDLSGLTVADKVYDGTVTARLSGQAVAAALPGDAVTLGGTAVGRFVDKNVGTDKTVTVTGLTLGGADGGNYTVSTSATLKGDITPLSITVQGAVAAGKVYDGTVDATLSNIGRVNALGGDSVTLGGTLQASFGDKNVGTAKAVSVTGYALSGPDAGNYTVAGPTGLSASITPRPLSADGVSVVSKVYDGTTAATLSGASNLKVLAGDSVSLTGNAEASFADKNVGTAKPVTVSGLSLSGPDAGNYTLLPGGTLTGDITPRPLSTGGLTAQDKVYDGTTTVTLSGALSVSGLPGDNLSISGTPSASFADRNAGQNKPVTIGGFTLGGTDAGNYSLSATTLSASITPRPLTVTGLSAADKTYDGTLAAQVSGQATLLNALPGDSVSLGAAPSGSFSDKNVGQGKAVNVTGIVLAGADAGNYTVPGSQGLTASITPREVAVSGLQVQNKVYDGTTTAALAGVGQVAVLAGDSVQVSGGTANFSDPNVGNGKPVNVTGLTLSGPDADNYRASASSNVLVAAITPATLLYVADQALRTLGQPITGLTGSVSGFVGGDSAATATQGTAVFTSTATAISPAGSYAVQGSGLTARNYVFAQAPGNAGALTLVPELVPTAGTVVDADRVMPPGPPTLPVLPATTTSTLALPTSGVVDLTAPAPANPIPASTAATASSTAGSDGSSGRASAQVGTSRAQADFGAVPLASLTPEQVQNLLAGRAQFMQNLLAPAVSQLERNPQLADLRECEDQRDAERGVCLISTQLKARIAQQQQQRPAAPVVAAPVAPPAPSVATPPSAAATPAPAPAPAPVAAAPAPAAPAAPAAARPAPSADAARVAEITAQLLGEKRRVRAASLPQIERKIALVVGVDQYQDGSIPQLKNARRDARAIAKVFEGQLGYEVVLLEDATKPALVAALNRLALSVGPRDSVMVYYAGHGEQVESTKLGYWLLSDSVAQKPETWLSNSDINRLIAQIGASQVALVSDSCFSGSLASEERIRPVTTPPSPQSILERKSVVVMSSGGNEPVADEGRDGHSPFAHSLMGAVSQVNNWQAGGNVFERVRFAVARVLPQRPQYSASRAAGHQAGGDYLFEQRQLDQRP